jgi:hypothetical protein
MVGMSLNLYLNIKCIELIQVTHTVKVSDLRKNTLMLLRSAVISILHNTANRAHISHTNGVKIVSAGASPPDPIGVAYSAALQARRK